MSCAVFLSVNQLFHSALPLFSLGFLFSLYGFMGASFSPNCSIRNVSLQNLQIIHTFVVTWLNLHNSACLTTRTIWNKPDPVIICNVPVAGVPEAPTDIVQLTVSESLLLHVG